MFRMNNDYIVGLKRLFGKNFKAQRTRQDRRWSLEKTAAMVGLSRAQIQKYEKGVNFPEVAKLIVIADIFGVSLDDLIGRKIPRKEEGTVDPVSEAGASYRTRRRKVS